MPQPSAPEAQFPRLHQPEAEPDAPETNQVQKPQDILFHLAEQDRQERSIRDRIRRDCRKDLEACARNRETVMTDKDVQKYMRALEEENLTGPDMKTGIDRTNILRDFKKIWIPEAIRDAEEAGRKAMYLINEAKRERWISEKKAEKWRDKLKNNTEFREKIVWIDETLPGWQRNWAALYKEMEEVKELKKELTISAKDEKKIKELKALSTEFTKAKCPKKIHLAAQAKAKLLVMKRDRTKSKPEDPEMRDLFKKANVQLDRAVQDGALAKWKKGTWLKRIFESKADPTLIEQFVKGEGPSSLEKLIKNWSTVRGRFNKIEKQRKEKGTPRMFHFVHKDIFLDWNYERRIAYVQEAEHQMKGVPTIDLLFIRHEMATENWELAEELIAEAMEKNPSTEDLDQLQSMAKYLREHRGVKLEKADTIPHPQMLVDELNGYLDQIPESERITHLETITRGFSEFRCCTTLWYNRVWCHQHHYLDEKREMSLQKKAEATTQDHIKHGHAKSGLEVNDLTGQNSQHPAIRDQEHIRAPQILFTGDTTDQAMLARDMSNNAHSYNYWYWTTLVPKDVSFRRHEHIVRNIHPKMKNIVRKLGQMGQHTCIQNGRVALAGSTPTPATDSHEQSHTIPFPGASGSASRGLRKVA